MSTAELKSELIKNITSNEDLTILNKVKEILRIEISEKEVYVFTPEQRKRIENSIKNYEAGNFMTEEDAEKDIQKWL